MTSHHVTLRTGGQANVNKLLIPLRVTIEESNKAKYFEVLAPWLMANTVTRFAIHYWPVSSCPPGDCLLFITLNLMANSTKFRFKVSNERSHFSDSHIHQEVSYQCKCCLRDPGDYSVSFCVSVKYDARQSRIENNNSNRQQHCQDRSRTASNTCCVKCVQGGICRSNKSLRLASKKCVCCLIPILFYKS